MITLDNIEYKWHNERDLEIPAVIDFMKSHPDIVSLLDVGAHYSHNYYAPELRKSVKQYDGIDILFDPEVEKIVDNYIVGNVSAWETTQKYDCVICISSIEHAGISTYKEENYLEERMKVFQKILDLSKKYVFITFPFGQEALHENEFANVTRKQLAQFLLNVPNYSFNFYFSESPFVDKIPYQEVDIEFASNVEYKRELGTRCVCIMEIEK